MSLDSRAQALHRPHEAMNLSSPPGTVQALDPLEFCPHCDAGDAVLCIMPLVQVDGSSTMPFINFIHPNSNGTTKKIMRQVTVPTIVQHSGQCQLSIWFLRPPNMNLIKDLRDVIERSGHAHNPALSQL
ncbi:hypothetical protein TNCV_869041 [Trichonephila clavipes]|nr:hypothetical protein TNCV_869041 [Trichonephila clavipes]